MKYDISPEGQVFPHDISVSEKSQPPCHVSRLAPLLIVILSLIAGCHTDEIETPVPEVQAADGPVVVVLGSAQDGGFPHAGCYCAQCERARLDPAYGRLVASLGVVFPGGGGGTSSTPLRTSAPSWTV